MELETHDDIVDGLLAIVEHHFESGGTQFQPVGLLCEPDGNQMVNIFNLEHPDARLRIAESLRERLANSEATAYAIVAEVSIAWYDAEKPWSTMPEPHKRPDARRAVSILVVDQSGCVTQRVHPLNTEEDGTITVGDHVGGLIAPADPVFLDLLDRNPTIH